ncbi:MAG: Ig-like domain-containing protein, partial [Planctomycetaceae bacterium]
MRRLAWWLIDWRRLLASHLRLRNGRRIRGSIRRVLQRATGQRSAARPRRSAPPPLHPARTLSLEPRHLLSTLTAVADTARVRGGAPLELDPLRNDHSSAGPLHLTAVTAVSHGSAQLRDLDDDGQFDRVVFTPSPGYTGPAGFTYFVRDGSGAVATATVSLTIDSAQSLLTSNASGQLAVVGGLGGVGYRADPRAGFTPSLLGNYSREESAANDAWSPKLSITGQSQSSTGTQGLTHATQATYADGSNWTYTESVAFQYSQSASVPGGDSRWLWGGYTYIFSVTMVAGVRSTSLAYTGFDSERAVLTSTGDNSSFTNSSLASRVYRLDVGHLSSPITGNSGWSMETTVQSRTFSGQGTYHRPLPGGLLDGTTVATGQSVDLSFTTQHHTQETAGNWSVIGQASASGTGTSDSGWSGSGPWSSGPWVGAVSSDAGGQQSLSHYSAVATLNTDGRWNWTGTGRLTDSGYNATRQEAVAVESLQWPGGTRESQHRQLAESSSQTRADISWQLVDDQWEVAGGTKWSNGGSRSQLNSTTQGTYRWHAAGGAVDGIFGSTDQGTFRSDYSTVSHWNLGDWTTAGTGQTDSTRQVVSSSLGTGTYHTIADQSASGQINRQIATGVRTESADSTLQFHEQADWRLNAADWAQTGGTRLESASRRSASSSLGAGTYERGTSDGPSLSAWEVTGTFSDLSQSESSAESYQVGSQFVAGTWQQHSGLARSEFTSSSQAVGSGTGTCELPGAFGARLPGDLSEEFRSQDQATSTTQSTWSADMGWLTTGLALANHAARNSSSRLAAGEFQVNRTSIASLANSTGTSTTATDGSGADASPVAGPGVIASGGGSSQFTLEGTQSESASESRSEAWNTRYEVVDPRGGSPRYAALDSAATLPPTAATLAWRATTGELSRGGTSHWSRELLASGSELAEGSDSLFDDWATSGTAAIVTQVSGSAEWELAASLADAQWRATSGNAHASELTLAESHQAATGSYSTTSPPQWTPTGLSTETITGDLLTGGDSRTTAFWQTSSTVKPGTLLLDETPSPGNTVATDAPSPWSSVGSGWHRAESAHWQRFIIDQGTDPHGQFTQSHYVSQSAREERTLALSATGDWDTASGTSEALSTRGSRLDYDGVSAPTSTLSLLGGLVTLQYAGTLSEEGYAYDGEGVFAEWTFDPLAQEWAEPDVGWLGESGVEHSAEESGTWSVTAGPLTGQLDSRRELSWVEHEQSRFSEAVGWRGGAHTDEFDRSESDVNFSGQLTLDGLVLQLNLEGNAARDWAESTQWTLTPDQRWVQAGGDLERDEQSESTFRIVSSSTRTLADGSETEQRGQLRKSQSEVWDRLEFDPTAPVASPGAAESVPTATEDDDEQTASGSADEQSGPEDDSQVDSSAEEDEANTSSLAGDRLAPTRGAWRQVEGRHAQRGESVDWIELSTQGTYQTAWETDGTWSSTATDNRTENWWIERVFDEETSDWRAAGRASSLRELRQRSLWQSDSELPDNATADAVADSSSALTGSYSESGLVEQSLVYDGSARLTSAGWSSTLTATASSQIEAEARLDYATSWSDTTDLGSLSGTTTGFAEWSWNAETTLTAELDRSGPAGKPVWRGVLGEGSAHWLASGEASFSGTGAVSQSFDDGYGTATGTQNRRGEVRWQEEYDETREYLAEAQRFEIVGEGEGTGTGITRSAHVLSGQTGDANNGSQLVVAGEAEDRWSADWEWSADGTWSSFLHEWGTRQQTGTLTKKTKVQTTAQPTAASTTGTISTSSEGKFVEVQREDGAYSIETEWRGDWAGSEWTREAESRAEGSRGAEWTGKAVVSWNTKYDDGTLTRTDVGSDTVESRRTENSTWGVFTTATTRSDGWGQGRTTREGTRGAGWSLTRTVQNDWTETRKSAPSSSWGGGGSTGSTGYTAPTTKKSGSTSSQTQLGETATPESWGTTVSWTTAAIAVPGDAGAADGATAADPPVLGAIDLEAVFGVLREPVNSEEEAAEDEA